MFAPPPPPIPAQPLFLPPEGLAIPRSARSADAWNSNNNNNNNQSGASPNQEPSRRSTQRNQFSDTHASAPSLSSTGPNGSANTFMYEDRLLLHMLYQQQQAMQVQLNQMSLLIQQLQLSMNSGLLNLSADEFEAVRAQHYTREADAPSLHRRSPYQAREEALRHRHPQATTTSHVREPRQNTSNASVLDGDDDLDSIGPSRRGQASTSSAPRGTSTAASRLHTQPPVEAAVAPRSSSMEVTASHAFYTPPLRQSDEHRSSPISTLQQTRSTETTQFRIVGNTGRSSSAAHDAEDEKLFSSLHGDGKPASTQRPSSALLNAIGGGTSSNAASAPRDSAAPNAWMDAHTTSRILSSVSSTPMGSRSSVLGKENPLRAKLPLSRRSASDASSSHAGYNASANISSSIDDHSTIQSQERPRLRLSGVASGTPAQPAKHVQPKLSAVSAWRPHVAGSSNSAASSFLNASSDRSGSNVTTIRSAAPNASVAPTVPQTASKPKPTAPSYEPTYSSAANQASYNDESQSDGYGSYETKQYLKHRGLI